MAKRVTIMLDEDLDKKLRMIQAKAIQSTNGAVSFSTVLSETLRNSFKKQINLKIILAFVFILFY